MNLVRVRYWGGGARRRSVVCRLHVQAFVSVVWWSRASQETRVGSPATHSADSRTERRQCHPSLALVSGWCVQRRFAS